MCLITKCSVTEDVIEAILGTRQAGVPVIVYLSYSGLGPDIERGIDHDALRANFPRLQYHQIPVIHYWRPLMPANAAPETITSVLDLAARCSTCSVALGLKVKPGAIAQMTELWPELRADAQRLEAADAVWPRQTWELLETLPERHPDHPIFQAPAGHRRRHHQRPGLARRPDRRPCDLGPREAHRHRQGSPRHP